MKKETPKKGERNNTLNDENVHFAKRLNRGHEMLDQGEDEFVSEEDKIAHESPLDQESKTIERFEIKNK